MADRASAASYVMRVDGHSMAEAGILHGDYIVVSRARTARAGDIVVALVHGDRTLKRLRRIDGRLWLEPEAADYASTIVDENVEVWGVTSPARGDDQSAGPPHA